jgi:hypothetical protein
VFRAGSRDDFYAKLQGILDDPAILSTALAGRARLYSPLKHYDLLRQNFYQDVPLDLRREMHPVSDASAKRREISNASAMRR